MTQRKQVSKTVRCGLTRREVRLTDESTALILDDVVRFNSPVISWCNNMDVLCSSRCQYRGGTVDPTLAA
jgi:hypothetical protein